MPTRSSPLFSHLHKGTVRASKSWNWNELVFVTPLQKAHASRMAPYRFWQCKAPCWITRITSMTSSHYLGFAAESDNCSCCQVWGWIWLQVPVWVAIVRGVVSWIKSRSVLVILILQVGAVVSCYLGFAVVRDDLMLMEAFAKLAMIMFAKPAV